MNRFADLLEKHADELASLDCLDNGKPFSHCKGFDLAQCVQTFRYFAGWCDKISGQTISLVNIFKIFYVFK